MKSTYLLPIGILLATLPAVAHHSSATGHDMTRPVTLRGVVTGVEWHNPHAIVHLDVKNQDGKVVNWLVALCNPGLMKRLGMAADAFKPGDQMTVDVWVARDGSPQADVRERSTLALPDGMKIVIPAGVFSWTGP